MELHPKFNSYMAQVIPVVEGKEWETNQMQGVFGVSVGEDGKTNLQEYTIYTGIYAPALTDGEDYVYVVDHVENTEVFTESGDCAAVCEEYVHKHINEIANYYPESTAISSSHGYIANAKEEAERLNGLSKVTRDYFKTLKKATPI